MRKLKKIFGLPLYLSVALLALTACENPVVEPPEPDFDGKYVELVSVDYAGDYQSNNTYQIAMQDLNFSQNNDYQYYFLVKTSSITKKGDYYPLKEGKYDIKTTDVYLWNDTWNDGITPKSTDIQVIDGTSTISVKKISNGYRYDIKFTDIDGITHKLRYEGIVKTNNRSEPTEITTENFTVNKIDYCSYIRFSKNQGDNVLFRFSNENNTVMCIFGIIVPFDASVVPYGTYEINNTNEVGTVFDKIVDDWGKANFDNVILFSEDGYCIKPYSWASGTVNVTEDGFIAYATSENGSTINVVYTGTMPITASWW